MSPENPTALPAIVTRSANERDPLGCSTGNATTSVGPTAQTWRAGSSTKRSGTLSSTCRQAPGNSSSSVSRMRISCPPGPATTSGRVRGDPKLASSSAKGTPAK